MSQRSIPQIGSLTAIVASDTAATNSTLVERDTNGDIYANSVRAGTTMRNTGSRYRGVTNKTTTFTVDDTHDIVTCDSTSGSVTVNLPLAASSTGKVLTIVKTVAANSVILDGSGSETINGATTLTLSSQYATKTIFCTGTEWLVIGS